jgi:transcription initiation factor TFIIB
MNLIENDDLVIIDDDEVIQLASQIPKPNLKKSLKKKTKMSSSDKKKLWNVFETEVESSQKMECLCRTIQDREYCDHCNFKLEYSDEGFLSCTNNKCGIIYKDVLDQSAEWRYYGADDNQTSDPTRCGMPTNPLLEESSFGCKVVSIGKTSYETRKLRRYTEWQSIPYGEKIMYDEFQRIIIYAQNAGISKKIVDDAIRFHKKISVHEHSFRGDNKSGLIIASIYISFRINKYPRTAKELASMFHVDVGIATKGCKIALSILNDLECDSLDDEKTNFVKTTSIDFIERFCSRLNVNSELTQLCKFISSKIESENLMQSNTPNSIAAGIVYFISHLCRLNITKLDIKNVSEISEVTINKCAKVLEDMTSKLIPPVIIRKYNIQL